MFVLQDGRPTDLILLSVIIDDDYSNNKTFYYYFTLFRINKCLLHAFFMVFFLYTLSSHLYIRTTCFVTEFLIPIMYECIKIVRTPLIIL